MSAINLFFIIIVLHVYILPLIIYVFAKLVKSRPYISATAGLPSPLRLRPVDRALAKEPLIGMHPQGS